MTIQLFFDVGVQWIVLVLCLLCTASTHGTVWQETSACYGADQKCSSYKIVCSPGQKIVLGEMKYGTKFTTPSCQFGVSDCSVQEKLCCLFSNRDRFTDFSVENRTNLLENCEGKQICSGWAPRLFNSPYSSYILIKFACVEDKKNIVNICRANRVEANEVFLSYGRPVGYQSPAGNNSASCTCRVTPRNCDAYLDITFVDLDFTRPGTTSTNCSNSVLTDSALGKNFGCLSADNVRTMSRFSVLRTEDIVTLKVQPLGEGRDSPNYLLIYYYSTAKILVECFPAGTEVPRTTYCQTTAISTPPTVHTTKLFPSSTPTTPEPSQSTSRPVIQTSTVPKVSSQTTSSRTTTTLTTTIIAQTTKTSEHSSNSHSVSMKSALPLTSSSKTSGSQQTKQPVKTPFVKSQTSMKSKPTSTLSIKTTDLQRTNTNYPIKSSSVVSTVTMKSEPASTSLFKTTGSQRTSTDQPMQGSSNSQSISVKPGSVPITSFTTIASRPTPDSQGQTARAHSSHIKVSLISVISSGSSSRSTAMNTQSPPARNPVTHSSSSYSKTSNTNQTLRTKFPVTKYSAITSNTSASSVANVGSSDATRSTVTVIQSSIKDLATASGVSQVSSKRVPPRTTSPVEVHIDNNDDNGSNNGLIIGLAVGAVLLVAIVTAVIVMCFCVRLKRNEKVRRNYIQNTNIFYSFPEDYDDGTSTEFDGAYTINANYESAENENAPQSDNQLRLDDYKIKGPQVLDLNTRSKDSATEVNRSGHVEGTSNLGNHETIDIVNNSVYDTETNRSERNYNNQNGLKTVTFDDSSMYAKVRKEGKTKF